MPHDPPPTVQTALTATPGIQSRPCPACGAALRGKQTAGCADRCRAKGWRQRQEAARQEAHRKALDEVVAGLTAIERLARVVRERLEK